jgi:hypothetical protein
MRRVNSITAGGVEEKVKKYIIIYVEEMQVPLSKAMNMTWDYVHSRICRW